METTTTLPVHEPAHPMRRLFQYLAHYKAKLWFAISSSVLNKIFDLMPPILTGWMIDTASGKAPAWISSVAGTTDLWSMIIFLTILMVLAQKKIVNLKEIVLC